MLPPVLDRRRLLQGVAALGLAATVGGAAACESAVSQASSAGDAVGEPVRGGTIAAGIVADLIPGNLLTNSNTGITTVVGLVFDSLIRYPNDQVEPAPRLATAWELAPDGRSLSLDLRDDVVFHSGRPFTSKDVEFSLKAYADPLWTAQLRSTAAAITSYDTTEPHRVVLGFDHPLGNVFDLLDTAPVLDSETVEQLRTGEQIIGTGPFRLTSWSPNSGLRLDRNPDYWVPGRPYADAVDVSVITDPKALLAALRSGQVQFANGLGSLDVENLARGDGFDEIRLEGAEQQLYVGSNVTAKPLDDVRLRKAIAFALDRDRVVAEVLRGAGYPVNLPWPTYSPAYDEAGNSTYARDLDRARSLVAEVGNIPALPLTYTPTPTQTATAAIVQADLAEVGITVTLDPVDGAQFVKQLIGAKFRGLWLATHSWAQYTPSTLTVSAYPFNARKNASQYADDDYVADADAAWSVADGTSAAAVAAYAKVSEDLLDAAFLAEIAVLLPQWVTSSRLRGVSYTKRAELQLTDAWLA
ncbi:peptide/nickel transport system substrate-binding protein [Friedmanniella luteola]|uniref:Peptide/nickel transport system substrate-binding protein n=1 Tax=Friedmanniella luteola TaxID=546871 RepID=A0A1H1SGE8_9ACTN|nr:ABC transporter substrate-binding protein [Friedmanniella luteola]SDS47032.1 peptide/nickel transport system substrate-binding protein [Friedmanniella luteola]